MADFPDERSPYHTVAVLCQQWLSDSAFELVVEKPQGFTFHAGQKVLLEVDGMRREYSLASSPQEKELVLCIRYVPKGAVSARLAALTSENNVLISDAYGFFVYRPGRAVFVATGTGIAPFVAYAKSGIQGYILLHGVREVKDLYYQKILKRAVKYYIPCISGTLSQQLQRTEYTCGRVTEYLASQLPKAQYDFYLCGNGAMIRDATRLIDELFSDSRLFSEVFYNNTKE